MSNPFSELISHCHPYTMDDFIEVSNRLLPTEKRLRPWAFINHGTNLLSTEDELCAYIAAYGEMHERKCRAALQQIDFERLGFFEVWDWGCGQGLASLTFIDVLREREKLKFLRKVTLVEPSEFALKRAELNIRTACPHAAVVPVNKYLPSDDNTPDQINAVGYSASTVIHLFSNILDIESVNLSKVAHLMAMPGHKHYVICVGPMNRGAHRIDQFASIFENSINILKISNYEFGYTSSRNKRFTCKSNCFIHDGGSLNDTYDDNIKPYCLNGIPLENDYDTESIIRQSGLSEKVIPFFRRLEASRELNEHDSIFITPEIYGNHVDVVLLRRGKGILLLNIFKGKPNKAEVEVAVKKLHDVQKELMTRYLEQMCSKVIANKQGVWKVIQMGLLFADCSSNELCSWLGSLKQEFMQNKQPETKSPFDLKGAERLPYGIGHVMFIGNDALTEAPKAMPFGWFAPISDNANFEEATYKSALRILSPDWHSYKEGTGITLDNVQKALAAYTSVSRQINGVAGSGKTQVLVQRAVNTHLATGQPVLMLSYNITLANYLQYRLNQVKADFGRNEFKISSYHRFFKENALSLGLKPIKKHSQCNDDESSDEDEFSYDDIHFFDDKKTQTKRFHDIFIDEVQDFKPEWIRIIADFFLEEGGKIVVFGDASQNIYHRPLDSKGQIKVEVAKNGWNNSLTKSHRYMNTVLSDLVADFRNAFITKASEPTNQTLGFQEFKCLSYFRLDEQINPEEIAVICNSIITDKNIDSSQVAIVSNHIRILELIEDVLRHTYGRQSTTTFATTDEIRDVRKSPRSYHESDIENITRSKKIHFTVEDQRLKIATIHSFKGWEIANLIMIIESDEDNSELIYTALTRARQRVFVINCGNDRYHDFFNSHQ